MSIRPRLQLIAPQQVRLLKDLEYNLDPFKKGEVISVERHQAESMVDLKQAELVKDGDKLESINRFNVVEHKTTKAEQKQAEAFKAVEEPSKDTQPQGIGSQILNTSRDIK